MLRKYSWKPSLPDYRDFIYTVSHSQTPLPSKVDLRTRYNKVYDQGQLGSCVDNATSLAFDFEKVLQNQSPILPSRLFLYYNARLAEGTTSYDSGSTVRDGIKTFSKQGACPETSWPYIISKFRTKPSSLCYTQGLNHQVKQYLSIDNTVIHNLKACLAANYGFIFGFSVYSSFESNTVANTGIVPIPGVGDSLLGGHCCYCLGYDDENSWFICRNSWGTAWGDAGHFYLPYSYMTNPNLASDFWTIRLV